MTRIGFWFDYGLVYAGGLNYFRNLLHAVHAVHGDDIQTVLFIGKDVPAALEAEFARVTQVVKVDVLTRGKLAWFFHRLLYRGLRSQVLVRRILRKQRIDVVSHGSMLERLGGDLKVISWIPDFQYLHLPHLFRGPDPRQRTAEIIDMHQRSHAVIVSSQDAHRDFASVVGSERPARTHVLPFVSQTREASPLARQALLDKHGLPGRFFMLPNQFWGHKNHLVAFEAVKRLKDKGIEVTLVCTGLMFDPHKNSNPALAFLENERLQSNIRLLGSIDYAEVLGLMRASVAVLNPSLFEGWSSSVEEARSMGKAVIVSSLAVHREQAHPKARYFDPHDADELAGLMETAWQSWSDEISEAEARAALDDLKRRTVAFGQRYLEIARSVAGTSGGRDR